jgi:U4/U6 small nuclear ribonucleoprotein PRP3
MAPPPYSERKHSRDKDDYDRERNGTRREDMSKKRKSSDGTALPAPDRDQDQDKNKQKIQQDIENAKARIAEMAKKRQTPSKTDTLSIKDRIEAAKHRLAETQGLAQKTVRPADQDSRQARGGLAVNVHPALLDLNAPFSDRRKPQFAPKFSTTLANLNRQSEAQAREAEKRERQREKEEKAREKKLEIYTKPVEEDFKTEDNPYYDPKLDSAYAHQKGRKARPLEFNPHGKFIEKAQAARSAAKMEELKRKIEEKAKKAGLEEDLDVGDREMLLRPEPPAVEWWDEDYLVSKTYNDLETSAIKLEGEDTKITLYIQHPVPIPPLSVTHAPPPRPVKLTEKEAKKKRRIERAEERKDRQGKQLLGLVPPDPPKIKLSNLMQVLTSEAVKDPTAVERQVKRAVEARKQKHEQDNEARKLTKEELHAKDAEKREADVEHTGIHCCLFRIASLSNGRHIWRIKKEAQQLDMTGIIIINPRTNIVIVEGGLKAIKHYKRLMLGRIKWTENARSSLIARGNAEVLAGQTAEEEVDLSGNKCELVWEGELRARNFAKWVGEREANNDVAVRNFLGKNAEAFWKLAIRSEEA